MKKYTTFICTLLFAIPICAQIEESIAFQYDTIIPSFISFEITDTVECEVQRSIRHPLDAESILRRYLPLDQHVSVLILDTIIDANNNKHIVFEQYYKGVKLDGVRYRVHYKGDNSESLNGDFRTVTNLDVIPSLTMDQALNFALNYINASEYYWENDSIELILQEEIGSPTATFYPYGELVITFDSTRTPRLAYKFDVYISNPFGHIWIYVDAKNGVIISQENRIRENNFSAIADTRFYGQRLITTDRVVKYRLHDHIRGHIITRNMRGHSNTAFAPNYYDIDNRWTSAEYHDSQDDAALTAHWAAERTYDYFKSTFNRRGWNDKNGYLRLYINADLQLTAGLYDSNNAYWDGRGVTCGQGSGGRQPYVTLDVIAHEIGHGITEATADLEMVGESGAINEGFSDIWGVCVMNYALPNKGDSIWLHRADIGHNRNLSCPNETNKPDTYNGVNWKSTLNPNNNNDFGGVHSNSTVFSHWFYILSKGKIGQNNNLDKYEVLGIGIEKAANIAYHTLTVYLNRESNFFEMRRFSIKSAQDFYGLNSREAKETQNAWYAVGVGLPYFEIKGPDYMCQEGIYSISNCPQKAVVTWTIAPGVDLVEGQGDTEIICQQGMIRKRVNNFISILRPFVGNASLSATITNVLPILTRRCFKSIEVRNNSQPEIVRDTTIALIYRRTQKFEILNYNVSDSASLEWRVTGPKILQSRLLGYGKVMTFTPPLGGTYIITATNLEGCSPDNSATYTLTVASRIIKMVYANPVSYCVDIAVLEQDDTEATFSISSNSEPYNGTYTLELWSEPYGHLRTVVSETPTAQIPLNGLGSGTYFVKLIINNELVATEQLLIR